MVGYNGEVPPDFSQNVHDRLSGAGKVKAFEMWDDGKARLTVSDRLYSLIRLDWFLRSTDRRWAPRDTPSQ